MLIRTSLLAGAGMILFAGSAFAQEQAAPSAAPAASTSAASAPAVGQTVYDTAGGTVGTIDSINGQVAVVATGTNKVGVQLGSFAMGDKGPVMSMTKAQLDAAAGQAKATAAASVTAGAIVKDSQGVQIGTIKSVDAQYAVLDTTKAQVKLPLNAFAQSDGGLQIGMTKAQLDAAAAGAAGPSKK